MKSLYLAAALAATALTAAPSLSKTIVTAAGNVSGTFANSPFNQPATFTGISSQGNVVQGGFDTYQLDSLSIFSGGVNYTFDQTSTPFYFYSGQGISGFANAVASNVIRFNTATGAFIATDNSTFAVTNQFGANFSGTAGVTFTGGNGLTVTTAVPEPATWAMMLVGFGMVGFGLRSRRNGKVTTKVAFA